MPEDALATFLAGGQVYETVSGARSADVRRIVTYIDRDILQSGWLLGEEAIANKAAVVSVEHGEGTVLLIGFRAQHRAQTHGTFKLFFNALVNGRVPMGVAAAGGRGWPRGTGSALRASCSPVVCGRRALQGLRRWAGRSFCPRRGTS